MLYLLLMLEIEVDNILDIGSDYPTLNSNLNHYI